MQVFICGSARGLLVGTTVHVSKPGQSTYALFVGDVRYGYCCQDGCHDMGLRTDVRSVVAQAKANGAARVMLRTGKHVTEIEGLPVLEVSFHTGRIDDTVEIARREGGVDPGRTQDEIDYSRDTAEYLHLCLNADADTTTYNGTSYTKAQAEERRAELRTKFRAMNGEE